MEGTGVTAAALVYRESKPERDAPEAIVIAFHPEGEDGRDTDARLSGLKAHCQVVVPKAWRALNPRMYGPDENQHFAWFFVYGPAQPEPATFGDSLFQVEQFVHDVRERVPAGVPILLIGWDQGAALAVTLAGVIPEFIDGVLAFDGYLPEISGWVLPSDDLGGLPVMLVHRKDSIVPPALRAATAEALQARGASVTVGDTNDGIAIEDWVRGCARLGKRTFAEVS